MSQDIIVIQACAVTDLGLLCVYVSAVSWSVKDVFFLWTKTICRFLTVVSVTLQVRRGDVVEVISGHVTAGQPLCYQALVDLRSAVWAAWWEASGLFFSLSASASHCSVSTLIFNPHQHTHTQTKEDKHINCLFPSLQPHLWRSTASREHKERPWSQIFKHKHTQNRRGPLSANTSLHISLDALLMIYNSSLSLLLLHTVLILHTSAFPNKTRSNLRAVLPQIKQKLPIISELHLYVQLHFIHAIKALTLFLLSILSLRCVWCDASGLAQGTQLQYDVDTK